MGLRFLTYPLAISFASETSNRLHYHHRARTMHSLDPLATAPRDQESRAIGTRTLQQRETNDPRLSPRLNNIDVIPDNVSRTILPTSGAASVASEIVTAPSTANLTTNPGAISPRTPMPTASTSSVSLGTIASKSQCTMRRLLGMKCKSFNTHHSYCPPYTVSRFLTVGTHNLMRCSSVYDDIPACSHSHRSTRPPLKTPKMFRSKRYRHRYCAA